MKTFAIKKKKKNRQKGDKMTILVMLVTFGKTDYFPKCTKCVRVKDTVLVIQKSHKTPGKVKIGCEFLFYIYIYIANKDWI